jgi:hypothetical protein
MMRRKSERVSKAESRERRRALEDKDEKDEEEVNKQTFQRVRAGESTLERAKNLPGVTSDRREKMIWHWAARIWEIYL